MSLPETLAVPRLLLPGGQWGGPAAVTIDGGRITAVTPGGDGAAGGVLTAGLLDLHNNGAFGVDFATVQSDGWRRALAGLARRGVTSVQPTAITAPLPHLARLLRHAAAIMDELRGEPVARVLGVHLEGPFLSPLFPGAHRADWLRDPASDALDTLLGDPAAKRALRMVTLAPERPGAPEAIRRLAAEGIVVSLGHSDADAATAGQAANAGATMVTHLFNAMRPFRHRDPGLPGAALDDPRLVCGLIVDGQHVDPVACRVAFQAAAGRIAAVSDSILVAGLPPGTPLEFGGMPVAADATGLGRRPDGTISGAGIVLDEGVRRMIAAGISPAAVLRAATEIPADAMGRPELGRIAVGARADLVLWDESWHPRRVWLNGTELPA